MKFAPRRTHAAATITAIAATVAAATASSAAPVTSYKYFGSSSAIAAARAAGLKDAKKATKSKVALPKKKSIGLILLSGQSATSVRLTAATKQIGRLLGYSVTVCDPNFDPQKVQQCATSILAHKPSLIISISTNPGAFGTGISTAASRGIPWFNVGSGTTPQKGFNDYGASGFAITKMFDAWYFKQIQAKSAASKPFKLLSLTAPTVGISAVNSDKQMAADVKKNSAFELTVKHDLDLSNVVQDTLNTTKQVLQQHPDLGGISTYCDLCIPLVAQAVEQAQGGDRKVVIAGQYSTPQTVADIRSGTVDGVAEYAWETQVWAAVDQALQNWALHKAIGRNDGVFRTYSLRLDQPYMITKANARTTGPAPIFGQDYVTYFTTKWKAEFSGIKG